MQNVLIDTSGWIDFFRSPDGSTGDRVSLLIENDHAYLTGVIEAELLHGVRGKKRRRSIKRIVQHNTLSGRDTRRLAYNRKTASSSQK